MLFVRSLGRGFYNGEADRLKTPSNSHRTLFILRWSRAGMALFGNGGLPPALRNQTVAFIQVWRPAGPVFDP